MPMAILFNCDSRLKMGWNKWLFTLILGSLLVITFIPQKSCVFGQDEPEPEAESEGEPEAESEGEPEAYFSDTCP